MQKKNAKDMDRMANRHQEQTDLRNRLNKDDQREKAEAQKKDELKSKLK